jgi:hypothetical protein
MGLVNQAGVNHAHTNPPLAGLAVIPAD